MSEILNNEYQSMAANAIAHAAEMTQETIRCVASNYERPSVLFRPKLSVDGDQWCAMYGDDLQSGVGGFGDSPEKAMYDFDRAWCATLA
jgi:hypothetical protein